MLVARADRVRSTLGWQPRVPFPELVTMMVDADIEALEGKLSGKVARVEA